MGSRYGGLKQLDSFGPSGETIIDYSLYDAIRTGFGKVVFIIRDHFKKDFRDAFENKLKGRIETRYVAQELDMLPGGFTPPDGREKPWGTAHAVWVTRNVVEEPFAVINADDFYGHDSFAKMGDFLSDLPENDTQTYCTVSYYLKNTLSEHGTVNRGVCKVDENGLLVDVKERTKIKRLEDGRIVYNAGSENPVELPENTLVSMNMWGMVPAYFEHTEAYFTEFLREKGQEMTSEFYIPEVIARMQQEGKANVKVIPSNENWFGVTYQEDKPVVKQKLRKLIDRGVYPESLWT